MTDKCYMAKVEIDTGWDYIKEKYFCFYDNEKGAKDLIEYEIEQNHGAVERIDWLEFFEVIPYGAYRVN